MSDLNKVETLYGDRHRLVRFAPAQNLSTLPDDNPSTITATRSSASGKETRQFYEELINEPSCASVPIRTRKPSRKRKESDRPNDVTPVVRNDDPKLKNRLLKSAQNNELKDVKLCLTMGVDIDCKDEYDWTPLMCAAQSGAIDVVRYLLLQSCDKETKDSTGRTAAGIALIANQISTYELIQNGPEKKVIVKPEPEDVFFCELCDRNVTGEKERHETSLAHQLSITSNERKTVYQLPEHNRGYQMMLRSGWSDDRGLGPEGQGQKYPVKTVLRKNRACLGNEQMVKARVTHSEEEIREKPNRKVHKPKTKKKGKEWERAMRSYMNM